MRKTAGLSGRIAPETAAALRQVLAVDEARYQVVLNRGQVDHGLSVNLPQLGLVASFIVRDADYRHGIAEGLRQYCLSDLTAGESVHYEAARVVCSNRLDGVGLHVDLWPLQKAVRQAVEDYQEADPTVWHLGAHGCCR